MSLKTLFFPFSLIMTVVLIISYIKPEVEKILLSQGEIEGLQQNLTSIQSRAGNIDAITAEFAAKQVDGRSANDVMDGFFPNAVDQDRVIDALNYLGKKTGVSLEGVTITKEAETVVVQPQEEVQTSASIILAGAGTQGVDASGQPIVITPPEYAKPSRYKTELKVNGSYEGLLLFLEGVYGLDRENEIISFSLEKKAAETTADQGDAAASANSLLLTMVVSFPYYQKPVVVKNAYLLPLFNQGKMDFSVIDDIRKKADLPKIDRQPEGRANPFL